MEAAFRQAIFDSPNDDLPKLVFADWLDEQSRTAESDFVRHHVLFGDVSYGRAAGEFEYGSGGGSSGDNGAGGDGSCSYGDGGGGSGSGSGGEGSNGSASSR
jgi:uncharacterized protein (TIGR02996 family)